MTGKFFDEVRFEDLESLEELQELVNSKIRKYNENPREDLGGLTPGQATSLMVPDWPGSDTPIRLTDSLSEEEAREIRFVKNSRIFLETAREKGGLPSTRAGNLKRKDVAYFLEKMKFNPDRVERIRNGRSVINEKHVRPLNILRVFLETAELIDHHDGKFHTTAKAQSMLQPGRSMQLMKYLFLEYFQEFDLNYFTRCPEWNEFREILPYSLYRLSQFDDGWHRIDNIAYRVLLPSIFELADQRGDGRLAFTYSALILAPLSKFELLEGRKLGIKGVEDFDPQFRKTSLFERFIEFDLQ
ncbi:hypothetical protein KGY72_09325 [Candidatus Bipolaricaulota bacterium]|nr:hypothetical protein [Candidatus Bipolaricaulota bacterium]